MTHLYLVIYFCLYFYARLTKKLPKILFYFLIYKINIFFYKVNKKHKALRFI